MGSEHPVIRAKIMDLPARSPQVVPAKRTHIKHEMAEGSQVVTEGQKESQDARLNKAKLGPPSPAT